MQKFTTLVAKILLTILVLLVVLDYAYTTVYLHSSHRGKVENVFNSKGRNYDVVIFGSSRANNHFVPELFEKKRAENLQLRDERCAFIRSFLDAEIDGGAQLQNQNRDSGSRFGALQR